MVFSWHKPENLYAELALLSLSVLVCCGSGPVEQRHLHLGNENRPWPQS